MTDRLHSLTVVLEQDIREDDAEQIINAIRQLRGVLDVSGHVSDMESHMACTRARAEIEKKIWDVLHGR